jgi:outer membrane protein assembly factor BamD
MKLKKIFLIPALLFSLALTSCATSTDPADAYKGESANQIFRKGEEALADKSYQEAIKRYEALEVQYPLERNTETAQLQIIYAYYMNSDYASAEAAADRFIHSHPTNPHVDYAYYMRGLSNYYQNLGVFERLFAVNLATRDLSQVKKSYLDFAAVDKLYPHGPYAAAAHQYMVYLRNILAKHELDVAEYYYSREAYVASADRANLLVRHYQGAPTIPDGLVLMTKSYRKLNLTENANDSLRVLQYNYPNSRYVQEAMKD